MSIDTGNHPPIKLRPYRTPFAKHPIVVKTVNYMLAANIIHPSRSPWSFSTVVDYKKDGTKSTDFRKLNNISKKSSCPLPVIDDIKEVIRTVPPKHCKLDPLPINIMKEHMDVLANYIVKIVNSSFDTGYFSDKLKEAILCPLIKNIKPEPIFTNFRPVSNLSYLSKLIERLVCKQLVRYTNSSEQMNLINLHTENTHQLKIPLENKSRHSRCHEQKGSNVFGDVRSKCCLRYYHS